MGGFEGISGSNTLTYLSTVVLQGYIERESLGNVSELQRSRSQAP